MSLKYPLDDMNTTGFSSTSSPPLSLYTYSERVVVAVFFMLISVLDIIGNTMVILAVVFSKKPRTPTNVFVVSLSVADLLAGLAIPMSVVALLSPGDTWPFASEVPCFVGGLFLFISSGSSLLNLACIALNRAVLIKRPMTTYRWLYSKRNLAIMVATVWAVSILTMLIPPLCGVGWFGLDKQHRACSDIQSHHNGMIFDLIQFVVFYLTSLTVIFTSYAVIFVHVRRHFKTHGAHNPESYTSANASSTGKSTGETQRSTATREDARRRRIGRQQLQITKNLFVAFCVFLLCITPFCVTIMLTDDHRFQLFGGVLFLCNSCVNPIIYAAKHPQFKKVMRCMLRCRYSQIEDPSEALKALMACSKDH